MMRLLLMPWVISQANVYWRTLTNADGNGDSSRRTSSVCQDAGNTAKMDVCVYIHPCVCHYVHACLVCVYLDVCAYVRVCLCVSV